jgi:hypothetical protein
MKITNYKAPQLHVSTSSCYFSLLSDKIFLVAPVLKSIDVRFLLKYVMLYCLNEVKLDGHMTHENKIKHFALNS